MIKGIRMYYQKHGCEGCVATLEVEFEGGTVIRTIDFSGNAIGPCLFGAVSVINELQELLGQKPEGYVQRPAEKKAKGKA